MVNFLLRFVCIGLHLYSRSRSADQVVKIHSSTHPRRKPLGPKNLRAARILTWQAGLEKQRRRSTWAIDPTTRDRAFRLKLGMRRSEPDARDITRKPVKEIRQDWNRESA
jgi:hypothetical protein